MCADCVELRGIHLTYVARAIRFETGHRSGAARPELAAPDSAHCWGVFRCARMISNDLPGHLGSPTGTSRLRRENVSNRLCDQELRNFTASHVRQLAAPRGSPRKHPAVPARPFAPVERSQRKATRARSPVRQLPR